eukprot:2399951-Amphidinium_carterae.1
MKPIEPGCARDCDGYDLHSCGINGHWLANHVNGSVTLVTFLGLLFSGESWLTGSKMDGLLPSARKWQARGSLTLCSKAET